MPGQQFFSHHADIARLARAPGLHAACLLGVFVATLFISGPAQSTEYTPPQRPEIAVTMPPLNGLIAMLDPAASSICLLRSGADPHHFQLQPRTIEALNQSRLLVRTSLDDGGWPISPRHKNTLDLWPQASHAWLSPARVKSVLPKLAEALKQLNPARTSAIEQHLLTAHTRVSVIEQQWHETLADCEGVIMQHPSWLPLMHDLQVPVLAILESEHHGHESGPKQLEQALKILNQHPNTWLLTDTAHSSRQIDWLARHAKKQPRRITLDALGRCGESWDSLMQRNLELIRGPATGEQQP